MSIHRRFLVKLGNLGMNFKSSSLPLHIWTENQMRSWMRQRGSLEKPQYSMPLTGNSGFIHILYDYERCFLHFVFVNLQFVFRRPLSCKRPTSPRFAELLCSKLDGYSSKVTESLVWHVYDTGYNHHVWCAERVKTTIYLEFHQ